MEDNAKFDMQEPKQTRGRAPHLLFATKTFDRWVIKIAVDAKMLANDPTWQCVHMDIYNYFVKAILLGVKNILNDL